MRLERLLYVDGDAGWELSALDFFPDLTLLVGVTGVGKTRILQSIKRLRDIAQSDRSEAFWGAKWDVCFTSNDGINFQWSGEFEDRAGDSADEFEGLVRFTDEDEPHPKVLRELLLADGNEVFHRSPDDIKLRGKLTPKLSPFESALKILSHEEGVSVAHRALDEILFVDHSGADESFHSFYRPLFSKHVNKLKTLSAIRESNVPTIVKLAIVHANVPDAFSEIVSRFRGVFPHIEDIRFDVLKHPFEEMQILKIKEMGVDRWIPHPQISSGMLRTLMHLSRMMLWPDGTVILIDEFENSLGVNCIDFVTTDLLDKSRRVQFIITSHHPYIINNIGTKHWKIVTRAGAVVAARDAMELGLEESSHQAFIKLLNLEEYLEGISPK